MRFLTDENFPLPSVEVLRRAGHDILSASESLVGTADTVVLARARSEGRLLVTFDRDFGELVFRRRLAPPPGVIFLRVQPVTPTDPGEVLAAVVSSTLEFGARFTVVDRHRLRQRPLPPAGDI